MTKKAKSSPHVESHKVDDVRSESLLMLLRATGAKRNELLWTYLSEALSLGIDENNIVTWAIDKKYGGCAIYELVKANGGADWVKEQMEKVVNKVIDDKGRTFIVVEEGKLDITWRKAQDALLAHNCPIYVQYNRLLQPLWRWEKGDDGSSVLTMHLEPLDRAMMTDIISHHAVQFQRPAKRKSEVLLCDIDPPPAVITQLLGVKHWLFLTCRGIINAPTMRRDGSLLTKEGYDEETQLWYKSSSKVAMPPVPERPTRHDALKALAKLNGLLVGFPFDEETDDNQVSVARSVALAAMMTTVLRGALTKAVPVFLVTAPEARSGKTFLVHVISMIATGHIPPSTAITIESRPDEIEKRIEAAAMKAGPIVHFNNMPNGMMLDSARLSELCTEGLVLVRVLGRHEEVLCDCRSTTFFLNGNNIQVVGDLVYRTIECRLNADMPNPGRRTFTTDPTTLIREDRGGYLAAVFTIVRAFMQAGSPKPQKMNLVAGFENWSRFVQQPLLWLDQPDPWSKAIEDMSAIDPMQEEFTNLVNALRDVFGAAYRFTVAMCKRKAEEMAADNHGKSYFKWEALRNLMLVYGKIDERHFGRLLARHKERYSSDGWRFRRDGTKDGSAAYKLFAPKDAEATPDAATGDGTRPRLHCPGAGGYGPSRRPRGCAIDARGADHPMLHAQDERLPATKSQ